MEEPFLINPAVGRGKKTKTRAKAKPKTKSKTKKKKATVKYAPASPGRIGRRHRISVVSTKGGKLVTSSRSKLARRGIKVNPLGEEALVLGVNPVRRRRRRNPVGFGLGDVMSLIPYAFTAGAGAFTVGYVPKMLEIRDEWAVIGTKAATAIGGGMVVGNFFNRVHGLVFASSGLGVVVVDLINKFSPGLLSSDLGADPMAIGNMYGLNSDDEDYDEEMEGIGADPFVEEEDY